MNKTLSAIVSCVGRVSWLSGVASAIAAYVLVGIVIYGVVMRYVFRSPKVLSLELPEVLFIGIIALSLAYTQMKGGHVRVEMLTSRLRGKVKGAFGIVASALMIAYCVIVIWALWQRFEWNFANGISTVEAGIPLAPFSLIIVVGVGLLAMRVITEVVEFFAKTTKR